MEHTGRPLEPQVHWDATGTTLADASTQWYTSGSPVGAHWIHIGHQQFFLQWHSSVHWGLSSRHTGLPLAQDKGYEYLGANCLHHIVPAMLAKEVVNITTSGATKDDKGGVMTIDFQCGCYGKNNLLLHCNWANVLSIRMHYYLKYTF